MTASNPARWAEAGLVPWALSGTSTWVRFSAAVAEVGRRHQQGRELALGAGRGLEAHGVQPGDLGEIFCKLVEDRQQPLERAVVLVGMLGRRARAVPPAARSASGCTSSCTSPADRNWRRSPCSAPRGSCSAGPRRARSARAAAGSPPRGAGGDQVVERPVGNVGSAARWPCSGRAGWIRRAGASGRACTCYL